MLSQNFIERAVEYTKTVLSIPSDIVVKLDYNDTFPKKVHGYCRKDSETEYQIAINKRISPRQQLDTVLHELRHVHQHVTGRFKHHPKDYFEWDGIVYRYPVYRVGAHPHEKDANIFTKETKEIIYEKLAHERTA